MGAPHADQHNCSEETLIQHLILEQNNSMMKEKRKSFVRAVKLLLNRKHEVKYCENSDKVVYKTVLSKTNSLPVNVSLNDSYICDQNIDKRSTIKYFTKPNLITPHKSESQNDESQFSPSKGFRKQKYHSVKVVEQRRHQDDELTSQDLFHKPKYHSVKVRPRATIESRPERTHPRSSSTKRRFSIKRFKQKETLKKNQSLPNLCEDEIVLTDARDVDTVDAATKQMFKQQSDCDIELIEMSFE